MRDRDERLIGTLLKEVSAKVEEALAELQPQGELDPVSLEVRVSVTSAQGEQAVAVRRSVGSLQPLGAERSIEELSSDLLFNSEGHQVIALIAEADLEARAPDVLGRVREILAAADRTIEEAAVFPDDIRRDQPQTAPFHFVDMVFEDDGPVNPALPSEPHVLSAIEHFSSELTRAGTSAEGADALSWLIHLFGDIHQPLHCIERFSEIHPGGDRGGNSFRLRGSKRNLHSLWDSAVNVSAPLEETELRDQIIDSHPRTDLAGELAVSDPELWARRSHALARKHVYALREDPANPPRPTAAYIRNMERIGRHQAALGGYRLADRLIALLRSL